MPLTVGESDIDTLDVTMMSDRGGSRVALGRYGCALSRVMSAKVVDVPEEAGTY